RELSARDGEYFLEEFMTDEQRERFARDHHVDFAYESGVGRFRVNVYQHAAGIAAAMRVVPTQPPTLASLGLPAVAGHMLDVGQGLVLVTGPTGSGKSTTLAGMVSYVNGTRRGHILTVEDPIEFVHRYDKCVITQREIGSHAMSYSEALRGALREDPDVILVGEMRDLETIS